MAQRRHVAAPRELTQTHTGAYVARGIIRSKIIRPTGVVGLGDSIGGVY